MLAVDARAHYIVGNSKFHDTLLPWIAGQSFGRAFRMADHLLFFRCYNSPSAMSKIASSGMTERERQAVDRVLHARVKAPEYAILSWVRSTGPESILSARLCDIRAVANAF
jgi:hypothetical protein